MLYGTRTARIRVDGTEIDLSYLDGEVTWMYADRDIMGDTEYIAEPTDAYDERQGTTVLGYVLMMEPVNATVANPAPRTLAVIKDNDIEWAGELLTTPLDPINMVNKGEIL